MRAINEIISTSAPDFQQDWDRQLATAIEIGKRHQAGVNEVLLADEVGMGKTYVALAAIADYLFQDERTRNRKVLLIVPPNNTLARKWEQEIRSFDQTYLLPSMRKKVGKGLRPVVVEDYWELVKNLHDFDKVEIGRVSEYMFQNIAQATRLWHQNRPSRKLRRGDWPEFRFDPESPDFLDFCSRYSPSALGAFLNEQAELKPEIHNMINRLYDGEREEAALKGLFREFAQKQEEYEANIFVIGMGTLRRSRSDKREARLLNAYIASKLMAGRWETTRKEAFRQLVKQEVIATPKDISLRSKYPFEWFTSLGKIDLWGFSDAVSAVTRGEEYELGEQILQGGRLDKLLDDLRKKVIEQKLSTSGIGLAVVDEVHNWKGEGNGAIAFRDSYAGQIGRKLIMSATPFQLDKQELGKIFSLVSGRGSTSSTLVEQLLQPGGEAESALQASAAFLQSWQGLTAAEREELAANLPPSADLRERLARILKQGDLSEGVTDLCERALRYRQALDRLQALLGQVVIRHTKERDKRHFHAGREYAKDGIPNYAVQRRSLPRVRGYGDEGSAMLNFVAMRASQLVRMGMGEKEANARLMSGLTSSNAAFEESNSELLRSEQLSQSTRNYLQFLGDALKHAQHPKVAATVERAFSNWREGRKTLIFCERVATLDEIVAALKERMNREAFPEGGLDQAIQDRQTLLKDYRRVELYWTRSWLATLAPSERATRLGQMIGEREDLLERTRAKAGELGALSDRQALKLLDLVLLESLRPKDDASQAISSLLEENSKGLASYLRLSAQQSTEEIDAEEDDSSVANLATNDIERILEDESVWHVGVDDQGLHNSIWELLLSEVTELAAKTDDVRIPLAGILLDLAQGLRKVLLRLDVLQGVQERNQESLGSAVLRVLKQQAQGQIELSSWHRTTRYVQDVVTAEGSIRRNVTQTSRRQGLWKGVFAREEIVAEIKGATKMDQRANRCAAFNSPLLPDILVCTSIGSEGIDLHRQCAEIIHHDLPWNPAKLEQRIGRIDRVGSLAELHYCADTFRLNIGIPFLAHNYERFQYETLLTRAQRFEILLGTPDFSTDVEESKLNGDGQEVVIEVDGTPVEASAHAEAPMPEQLVQFLKMDLSVGAGGRPAVPAGHEN